MQEQKKSYSSYFVTLTYNTDYVPLTKRGQMTLVKTTEQYEALPQQHRYEDKDISAQGFIKSLRYYQDERKRLGKIDLEQYKRSKLTASGVFTENAIKYYLAGEYGSKRFRPHLHIILFNVISLDDIRSAWTFGEVWIDEVNQNTVEYTLKYICKPPTDKKKGFDGIPEFSLMSKGLGKNFMTSEIESFYNKRLDINYVVNDKGMKIAMPKYYVNKMMTEETKVDRIGYIKRGVEEMEAKDKTTEARKQENKFGRQARKKNYASRNFD